MNNYTVEEYGIIRRYIDGDGVTYGVIGREVGGGGTPHLQGFLIASNKVRCNQVRAALGGRAHCEMSRGTPRQAAEYCKKDGDWYEKGMCPSGNEAEAGQRKRSRDQVAEEWNIAFAGGRDAIAQFAERNPGVYAFSRYQLVRNSLEHAIPVERPNISVKWYWGPPGVGKSRRAHGELPGAYLKCPRSKWWNGYMLEKEVIMDDFAAKGIDITNLLRWFDRYKCLVEVKGSMVALYADRFIVTSNFSPAECFRDDGGYDHPQLQALLRRMDIVHMPL